MGIVIDLATYKRCKDLSLCIVENPVESTDTGYSTKKLYLLALQARKIIYYPSPDGGWKTSCAFNISQALKTGIYTLKYPEPDLVRLVIHENPLFYIDLYFRKSFYSSDRIWEMLLDLIEETIARKSLIDPTLCRMLGRYISKITSSDIDCGKIIIKPIDEDSPSGY